MTQFRKKPVVIEAVQFLGWESFSEMRETWETPFSSIAVFYNGSSTETMRLTIDTMEGTMTATIGDWIIRGIKGEFYPCKKDIFEATYEAV